MVRSFSEARKCHLVREPISQKYVQISQVNSCMDLAKTTDLFLAPSILDLLPLPSHLALCEEDLEVEEEDEEKRDEK